MPKSPKFSRIPQFIGRRQGRSCFAVGYGEFVLDANEYTPIEYLGDGQYGIVCKVKRKGQEYAIKKLESVFSCIADTRSALREIRILRKVRHPFIINLIEVMSLPPAERSTFENVYIVYELMHQNLDNYIQSRNYVADTDCKYILAQVLRGLKYLRSANILHRDLKPNNILLKFLSNGNMRVKLIDFGLSRLYNRDEMTTSVTPLTYRAPELLLQKNYESGSYDAAVDMWAAGCIFAEMLTGRFLFQSRDEYDQLEMICKVIPKPNDYDLDFIRDRRGRDFVKNQLRPPQMSLRDKIPNASHEALDLLQKMLVFDPRNRITIDAALRHPYLARITVGDLVQRLQLTGSEEDILYHEGPLNLYITPDESSSEFSTLAKRREIVWKEIHK